MEKMILAIIVWVALLVAVANLTGCQGNSRIEVPSKDGVKVFTGKVADVYGQTMVVNERMAKGRQNALLEKLVPYYGLLFIIGLGGLGACVLMYWMKLPVGRFLWIVPLICFFGMAFIHLWSDFARWIGWGTAGIAISIMAWKLVEWKWERNNQNEKNTANEK